MPTRKQTPPPGVIFELAEQMVVYVRNALKVEIDYTPDTLPVLDHYLSTVPRSQPQTVALIAQMAGAYFGEVMRRALDGNWVLAESEPWLLELPNNVSCVPALLAEAAIRQTDDDDAAGFEVAQSDRKSVAEALEHKGEVPMDEFFSLCGRLETVRYILDRVAQNLARGADR